MIIDEDYIISSFHLKSGTVLRNSLFFYEDGCFNFYIIDEESDSSSIKLYKRSKEKDNGEDCIIEKLVCIFSPDSIEYIELDEIENIDENMLEVINIEEMKEDYRIENRDKYQ